LVKLIAYFLSLTPGLARLPLLQMLCDDDHAAVTTMTTTIDDGD